MRETGERAGTAERFPPSLLISQKKIPIQELIKAYIVLRICKIKKTSQIPIIHEG